MTGGEKVAVGVGALALAYLGYKVLQPSTPPRTKAAPGGLNWNNPFQLVGNLLQTQPAQGLMQSGAQGLSGLFQASRGWAPPTVPGPSAGINAGATADSDPTPDSPEDQLTDPDTEDVSAQGSEPDNSDGGYIPDTGEY